MKILVSGSHGFIGTGLCAYLENKGHTLLRLIRPTQIARSDEVFWNPYEGFIDQTKLDGLDAVIHLAGENLFGRWNAKKKEAIYQSRIGGTTFLSQKLADMTNKPDVFVCASAIGYYGNRGDETVDDRGAATPSEHVEKSESCPGQSDNVDIGSVDKDSIEIAGGSDTDAIPVRADLAK